jgi:hypothetical protein
MYAETISDDTIECQASVEPQPLTDLELRQFLNAIDADWKLSRAAATIAIWLVNQSYKLGYVDATIARLSEVGRVTDRAAVLITKRLRERGYFTVAKGGSHRSNRFFPSKIPITIRRSRL